MNRSTEEMESSLVQRIRTDNRRGSNLANGNNDVE